MKLIDRIHLVSKLGQFLSNLLSQSFDAPLSGIRKEDYHHFLSKMEEASYRNTWFLKEHILAAIEAWEHNLKESNIKAWIKDYPEIKDKMRNPKTVGIVMAGNIPLVGFHDLLCVFLAGHQAICKMSSDDKILLAAILDILLKLNPALENSIQLTTGQLKNFDAVIATGSNNSSRYFEYYFGKYPNIIRKNRNSIAVLNGSESNAELKNLGHDIFQYFGLGCRNVSKLYVPHNYDFTNLFESLQCYEKVQFQSKYMNNYDFNKSIYLINKVDHFDNGFCLLKEDKQLASPISVLFFEYYADLNELQAVLKSREDEIQCIVGQKSLGIENVLFGETQKPKLQDYADGIDTLKFLLKI